jgi:hypothetical protein
MPPPNASINAIAEVGDALCEGDIEGTKQVLDALPQA